MNDSVPRIMFQMTLKNVIHCYVIAQKGKANYQDMSSFWKKSWGLPQRRYLRLYDADLDTRRYKVKDVRNFSKKQKVKKIRDLAAWKNIVEHF